VREIKFRVWDKDQQIMFIPAYLDFDKQGKLIDILGDDTTDGFVATERSLNRCVLMQYTGLKDKRSKNGVEIYEGDILVGEGDNKDPYVIVWEQWNCLFSCEHYSGDEFFTMYDVKCYRMRVLGNIYQHPQLLNKETTK